MISRLGNWLLPVIWCLFAGMVHAQTFSLSVSTPGGGTVSMNPPGGIYASNSIVTITATPDEGWSFVQWLDDAAGTNTNTVVTLSRDLVVRSVFGTTLKFSLPSTNNGSIKMNPPGGFYPYGTKVQLSAVPATNRTFALWFNLGNSNLNPFDNPLPFVLTNSSRVIDCLFMSPGVAERAFTAAPVGRGTVTHTPTGNSFTIGTQITATAIPEAGQEFLGWSGDTNGTNNPLTFTLNQQKTIYANFTQRSLLEFRSPASRPLPDGFQLTLFGDPGAVYRVDKSSNLVDWVPLMSLTNTLGVTQFMDFGAQSAPSRYYRSVLETP